uniref:J domain-containing protein n=1 Tax=Elaeophora elaphi TaxID=1147741 RepID=A0A0R3S3P2_9BILA
MANVTSTLDDQQERHYIGNLLCEEDVFGQTNSRTIGILFIGFSLLIGDLEIVNFKSCKHDEWDNVPSATMNAYMSTGMPYSSHRTVSVLKSLMSPSGTLDTMQQHHYQNMYRHHHQHLGNSPVDPRIFTTPPPRVYSSGESGLVHIDSYLPQHLPSKGIKKTSSPVEDVSSSVFLPEITKSVVLPLGKSYRDAASKKEHVMSSPSLSSLISNSPVSVYQNPSGFPEGKDGDSQASKSVASSNRISNNLQSIDETSVVPVSCNVNDVYTEQSEGTIRLKNSVTAKKGCSHGKKKADYEFQKITHKKNKGIKSNKNDQLITDEDGLAGNQAVDASSRFDVLQSLGTQVTSTVLRRVTRRSLSSVIVHHESSVDAAASKSKIGDTSSGVFFACCFHCLYYGKHNFNVTLISSSYNLCSGLMGKSGSTERTAGNGSTVTEEKTRDFNQNAIKLSSFSSTQRTDLNDEFFPVFKKMIGTRRELSAQASADSARCGRKQRNSIKKRQSSVADYINIMVALIFSVIKHALQWIMNLLWDISLQLWDITMYTIVAGYTNIVFNCQRCWYSTLDAQRKCWESIRLFDIKRLWKNQKKAVEWGLNENIQLPITGEEAMERILKCRGRDAYMVLGLRADCKDDEIKRYYKKQAVLVHPDKNRSSGADEAFKILSKAFDAIGTPDVRNKYNIANLHKNPLHKEMDELWERLREKMNAARNAMYCDCGDTHTRIPVESIRASEARYCKKCKLRHPAKHNDIWAETRFGGFIWVYYTCLDGVVYDITQWATCSSNHLKHMKANSHMVQYRLVTTTGPSVNKNPLKQTKNGQERHEYDDLCCYNRGGQDDDGCTCSVSLGYGAPATASQQASYRPPDRNPLNGDRPRRAGRRRRQR